VRAQTIDGGGGGQGCVDALRGITHTVKVGAGGGCKTCMAKDLK
jgi:hypothetical protein